MKEPDPIEELHRIREAMLSEYNGDFVALIRSFKKGKSRARSIPLRKGLASKSSAARKQAIDRASDKG